MKEEQNDKKYQQLNGTLTRSPSKSTNKFSIMKNSVSLNSSPKKKRLTTNKSFFSAQTSPQPRTYILKRPIGSPKKLSRFATYSTKRRLAIQPFEEDQEGIPHMIRLDMLQYGNLIATVGYGEIIGEIALINDLPRNASIYTLKDTEFMTLRQAEFDVIKRFYNKDFTLRRKFISEIFPELEFVKDEIFITNFLRCFVPVAFEQVKAF